MADTSSATVRRVTFIQAGPGLEVSCTSLVLRVDISTREILQNFNLPWILSNRSKRNGCGAMVEFRIFDVNVGGILLQSQAIVSVIDHPALEGDVIGVDLFER
jgi:hypothetical protein